MKASSKVLKYTKKANFLFLDLPLVHTKKKKIQYNCNIFCDNCDLWTDLCPISVNVDLGV